MSRRAALATGGSLVGLLAAGLIGIQLLPDTRHEDVGEAAWSNRQVDDSDPGRFITGDISLAPGEYTAEPFTVPNGAALRATVGSVQNPPCDIYTLSDRNIDKYRNAERLESVDELTRRRITGSRSVKAIPGGGDYWVIIDNTSVYAAEPTGELSAEVQMGIEEA